MWNMCGSSTFRLNCPLGVAHFLLAILIFGGKGISGSDYRFCSKDGTLYSFNSEACPGGVFLKEPLEIDPSCYCHETDLQIYNYCNFDDLPNPALRISYSPGGCQQDLILSGQTKPANHNKVRLMLLLDEKSIPTGGESECTLSCLENTGDVFSIADDFTEGLIRQRENSIQELRQSDNFEETSSDFFLTETTTNDVLKNLLYNFSRLEENSLLDVPRPERDDSDVNSMTLHSGIRPFTDRKPQSYSDPIEEKITQVKPNIDENMNSNGRSKDDELDTFPTFPVITYSDVDKRFLVEVVPGISDYLSTSAHHPNRKIKIYSNVFKLLRLAVTIYQDLVPDHLIENDLLDDIFEVFHYTFMRLDRDASTDRHMDMPKFNKVRKTLERCVGAPELQFVMDSSCPPQIIKVLTDTGDGEYQEEVNIRRLRFPEDRKFQESGEDFVVGTIWKIFDTIMAECTQNFIDDHNINSQHYFSTVVQDLLRRKEIQEKWFQGPGVELYQGLLRHEDLKFVSKTLDNVDIATHIRSTRWKMFLRKPQFTGKKTGGIPGEMTFAPTNPEKDVPLRRGKRSPLIKTNVRTKALFLPKFDDSDEESEEEEMSSTSGSLKVNEFIESEEYLEISTTSPRDDTSVEPLTIHDVQNYDAYLIWSGRAYCLQKTNTSAPASTENIYPPLTALCAAYRHKCQLPVSDKKSVEDSVLNGCKTKGWNNVFLKSNSSKDDMDNSDEVVVCCYEGSKCLTSITENCEKKCQDYCSSIGGNPNAEEFVRNGQCHCSTTKSTFLTYLRILVAPDIATPSADVNVEGMEDIVDTNSDNIPSTSTTTENVAYEVSSPARFVVDDYNSLYDTVSGSTRSSRVPVDTDKDTDVNYDPDKTSNNISNTNNATGDQGTTVSSTNIKYTTTQSPIIPDYVNKIIT